MSNERVKQAIGTKFVTNRRSFIQRATAASVALLGGIGAFGANKAAAGQIGYIGTQGAELFVSWDNLTTILYMDQGVPVDVFYGPHYGLYHIRYYDTAGWIWAEYLDLDGAPAPAGAPAQESAAESASGEHWIDVNRSSGYTALMIGNQEVAGFWASVGWEQTDYGFYATAIGTYYIYEFRKHLQYTSYADNYITHWIGFDWERYNGFHSYTKDSSGNIVPNGGGRTAGCVALAPNDIDQLWDFAQMGMRVEVHW